MKAAFKIKIKMLIITDFDDDGAPLSFVHANISSLFLLLFESDDQIRYRFLIKRMLPPKQNDHIVP